MTATEALDIVEAELARLRRIEAKAKEIWLSEGDGSCSPEFEARLVTAHEILEAGDPQ
jgi:hypothetical protein